MNRQTLNAAALGIALLPIVLLIVIYPGLPATLPMHFGADLQPNRWGPKGEIWFPVLLVSLLSVGVYFLFANLHKIDPKRNGPQASPLFTKLGFGLLVFMALLNLLLLALVRGETGANKAIFPLLGLLFAFTGYCLHNIKPNSFAGFRVKWTMHDPENWRRTHRTGGRLWLGGGLLIALVCPLLPVPLAFYFFAAVMAGMVCIPLVYSYHFFKKDHKTV